MRANSMHEAYRSLLTELYHSGVEELNERTQTQIKMLCGGHSFKLALSPGYLPVAGNRRYWPHIAAAETAWQLMGTQDPAFILKHAPKIWEAFVEDGELKTAYGYRWREHFGRDQLDLAMHELHANPTNRQLFISAWDPSRDGLGGLQPKNIPCPIGFSLTRTDDELHMSVFIRSSDVFVGLPYDVMCYALTLDAIASSLGLKPATVHFTLAHPHYYEPHFDMVDACVYGGDHTVWTSNVQPALPGWTVEMILDDPDGYVDHVKRLADRVAKSPYSPKPMVVA